MATWSNPEKNPDPIPHWYSPETGIYQSTYPHIPLPTDPFLDVVSFIFSKKHSGDTALVDSKSGHTISYSNLYPLVKSMASGLHQMGISQGDVVLVLLPNSIYFPIIFFAVLSLGAVATTMNPVSTLFEVKKQTSGCNTKLVFTVPERVDELKSLGVSAIGVPENLSFSSTCVGEFEFHQLICGDHGSEPVPRPVIRQDDTAVILYSSGTTGACKGVVLTHRNFISMIELFVRFEAFQYDTRPEENVYLVIVPMFHIYGLAHFVMGLLSLGTKIVVMRKFDAEEAAKAIDVYRITHFPIAPPVITTLTARAASLKGDSWKSLKQVSCGAAPISMKRVEEFVEAFPDVDFIQGYGMTETTAVGTRGFNTKKIRNYSSIGLLAPNMEARVVDWVEGSFKPPKKTGELWLRGPGIMKGYLNNPKETAETVDKDGWLHTGDVAHFDGNGYIYVTDRLKELIKYKGFQIAPAELEAILVTHPDIIDAAVTAAKDEEAGEIPMAFVIRRPGSVLSEGDVMNYVAKQVSPYKRVRKVIFTQLIPKSPAGKILRRQLKHLTSRI